MRMLARKYVGPNGYIFIIFSMIFFLYCMSWTPNLKSWYQLRESNKKAYDSLMNHILHPKAACKTSLLFGGVKRLKNQLDGDKLICIDPGLRLGDGCIVYSFGISNEWSFEEKIYDMFRCEVFAFDPSMGVDDHMHTDHIWFFNMAIGNFNGKLNVRDQTWNVETLGSMLKRMGHLNRTVDVLKMDIEGTEYQVLKNILDDGLLNNVNHLCVEFHLQQNPDWKEVSHLMNRIEAEAGLKHFSTRNNTQTPLNRVPGFLMRYEQLFFELSWYRD